MSVALLNKLVEGTYTTGAGALLDGGAVGVDRRSKRGNREREDEEEHGVGRHGECEGVRRKDRVEDGGGTGDGE